MVKPKNENEEFLHKTLKEYLYLDDGFWLYKLRLEKWLGSKLMLLLSENSVLNFNRLFFYSYKYSSAAGPQLLTFRVLAQIRTVNNMVTQVHFRYPGNATTGIPR